MPGHHLLIRSVEVGASQRQRRKIEGTGGFFGGSERAVELSLNRGVLAEGYQPGQAVAGSELLVCLEIYADGSIHQPSGAA